MIRAAQLFPITSVALRRNYAKRYICPECGGALDTGWECNDCEYDAQDIAYPPNIRALDKRMGGDEE